jgi:hypothetical protein
MVVLPCLSSFHPLFPRHPRSTVQSGLSANARMQMHSVHQRTCRRRRRRRRHCLRHFLPSAPSSRFCIALILALLGLLPPSNAAATAAAARTVRPSPALNRHLVLQVAVPPAALGRPLHVRGCGRPVDLPPARGDDRSVLRFALRTPRAGCCAWVAAAGLGAGGYRDDSNPGDETHTDDASCATPVLGATAGRRRRRICPVATRDTLQHMQQQQHRAFFCLSPAHPVARVTLVAPRCIAAASKHIRPEQNPLVDLSSHPVESSPPQSPATTTPSHYAVENYTVVHNNTTGNAVENSPGLASSKPSFLLRSLRAIAALLLTVVLCLAARLAWRIQQGSHIEHYSVTPLPRHTPTPRMLNLLRFRSHCTHQHIRQPCLPRKPKESLDTKHSLFVRQLYLLQTLLQTRHVRPLLEHDTTDLHAMDHVLMLKHGARCG